MALTLADLQNLQNQFQAVLIGPSQLDFAQPVTAKVLPATDVLEVLDPILNISLPVYVSVTWKVIDDDNKELVQNDGFLAPNGIASPDAVFVIASPADEPTDTVPNPTPKDYKIRAHVRLQADTITYEFDLPDIAIQVPVIPVLAILALCRHDQYYQPALWGNAILIVTPPGTSVPRDIGAVLARISWLRTIASRFAGFARFALFATGLETLASLLQTPPPKQPAIKIVSTAAPDLSINNLRQIRLFSHKKRGIVHAFYAEDCMSSLIFLAATGRQVELYNRRNTQSDKGQLNVLIDKNLVASIPSLHSPQPTSLPPGAAQVIEAASTFGNSISSLRLSWSATASGAAKPPVPVHQRRGRRATA